MRRKSCIPKETLALALGAMLVVAVGTSAAHTQPPTQAGCLEPAAWYSLDKGRPSRDAAEAVLRKVARGDVVLLGEQHDVAEHHHWQLQTLAALHLLRPRMVIGFESFPRRAQPVLERWIAGELTEKALLEQSNWNKVWNFPAELYMPLFQFARLNRIPMVALNVERSLTQAVTQEGWDVVPEAQREGLSRPAAPPPEYVEFLFETYKQHERTGRREQQASRDDADFRNFVASQTTWDRAMAEALAGALRAGERGTRPLVVGIIGTGHLRYGYGVPHQLRDLGVANVATLLPVEPDADCTSVKAGLADALFAIAKTPHEPAPKPRLGVRLQQSKGEVTLVDVVPGSLAEASGLKQGDRIVTIAGKAVSEVGTVITAVRAQPAGTWLPMQVRRGDESLDVVVRFPREP